MELLVAAILAIWLVLSVLNQVNWKPNSAIRRADIFHLIPRWHFFAPRPATFDYHFVYRTLSAGHDVVQDWEPILEIPRRTLLSSVWNPTRRLRKLRVDATQALLRSSREKGGGERDIVLLSLPYLLLLNSACSRSRDDAAFVQFAVLRTHGFESDRPPQVMIRSELHAIHD